MPDLSELTVDQRLSLSTAAAPSGAGVRRRLRSRRPSSCSWPPATTSSPTEPSSTTSSRSWPNASPGNASRRSPRSKARPPTVSPSCCSSASTTPGAARWPSAGSTTGRRPSRRLVRRLRTRPRGQPGRDRGHGRGRHRHHRTSSPSPGPTRSSRPPTSSITMGCGDACPFFPGKRYEDWELDDPAGHDVAARPPHPRRDQGARRRPDRLLGSPLEERALRCRGSLVGQRCTASRRWPGLFWWSGPASIR